MIGINFSSPIRLHRAPQTICAARASLLPLAAPVPLQLSSAYHHQLTLSAYSVLRVTAKRTPLVKALGEATLVERNLRDALPVDVEAVVQHFKRLEGNDTHIRTTDRQFDFGRRKRLPFSLCWIKRPLRKREKLRPGVSEKLVPTRPRASQRKDHFPRQ